jgi:large subunit ribosomal protein L2
MGLKFYKSYTKSIAQRVDIDRSGLWKGSPFKQLTEGMACTGGRNNNGHITSRHRTSVHRKVYRKVSFDRRFLDGSAVEVVRIEYDPNRTAHIALVKYNKEEKEQFAYLLAPENAKVGDIFETTCSQERKIDFKPGNCMPIGMIKDGTNIHNIELKIGAGGKLGRSAGTYAQVLGQDMGKCIVRLASGELRYINKNCLATVGVISNADHSNVVLGKAGRSVWLGRRPSVRGIAMNPVDHHNGGRANGGVHFASPKGLCAKGLKTRRNKRTTKSIIKRRK